MGSSRIGRILCALNIHHRWMWGKPENGEHTVQDFDPETMLYYSTTFSGSQLGICERCGRADRRYFG